MAQQSELLTTEDFIPCVTKGWPFDGSQPGRVLDQKETEPVFAQPERVVPAKQGQWIFAVGMTLVSLFGVGMILSELI